MKKWLAGIAGGLLVAALTGIAWFSFALPRQRPAPQVEVPRDAALVERGRYLVVNVLQCVDCHSERDWTRYGGPPLPPLGAGRECLTRGTQTTGINVGEESFPGTLCIRNITPDVDTGIGGWTDGEIMRAVREGVDREGRGLFPIMPYFIYRDLSDGDMMAVVAYLRTLPPVRAPRRPARQVDFPLNLLIQLWPRPLEGPVTAPDPADVVARGAYLARVARCEFCHTPRNPNSLEGIEGRAFAGGMPFFLGPDGVRYSMNLTPHDSGLGPWSRDDFIARFRDHSAPYEVDPSENTVMNWGAFSGMSEADLGALYDFFRTLPPVPFRREPV